MTAQLEYIAPIEAITLSDPTADPDERVAAAIGMIGLLSWKLRDALDAGGRSKPDHTLVFNLIEREVARARASAGRNAA